MQSTTTTWSRLFAILTTDKYGTKSEHRIAVEAEGEFMETEVRGSEAGSGPFDMLLTDAKKRTKGRELNFI